MHVIAHGSCMDTVRLRLRGSALKIDSGRKINCHTGDSNLDHHCTWLFCQILYQAWELIQKKNWNLPPPPPPRKICFQNFRNIRFFLDKIVQKCVIMTAFKPAASPREQQVTMFTITWPRWVIVTCECTPYVSLVLCAELKANFFFSPQKVSFTAAEICVFTDNSHACSTN